MPSDSFTIGYHRISDDSVTRTMAYLHLRDAEADAKDMANYNSDIDSVWIRDRYDKIVWHS